VVVDYKTGRHLLTVDDARSSLALALYALAPGGAERPCHRVELHHLPPRDPGWSHTTSRGQALSGHDIARSVRPPTSACATACPAGYDEVPPRPSHPAMVRLPAPLPEAPPPPSPPPLDGLAVRKSRSCGCRACWLRPRPELGQRAGVVRGSTAGSDAQEHTRARPAAGHVSCARATRIVVLAVDDQHRQLAELASSWSGRCVSM